MASAKGGVRAPSASGQFVGKSPHAGQGSAHTGSPLPTGGGIGSGGHGRAPVTPPAGSLKGGTKKMVRPSPKGGGKSVPQNVSGKRPAIAPAIQPAVGAEGGVPGGKKMNMKGA